MERRSFFIILRAGHPAAGGPPGFYGVGARSPFGARNSGPKEKADAARGEEENEERGAEDEPDVHRPPGCPLEVVDPVEEVDPVVQRSALTHLARHSVDEDALSARGEEEERRAPPVPVRDERWMAGSVERIVP